MTTSVALINRALDHALNKDPETLRVIIDLTVEYGIAVRQALKVERILHEMIKEAEK